jgi:tRNA-Thr(GGU) m(6)t(6)A37 methyltransferase TsaA
VSSSRRSDGEPERRDRAAGLLTRFDAHPFESLPDDADGDRCALCGERRSQIRHHPTRVRAACLLKGLDPDPVVERTRRGSAVAATGAGSFVLRAIGRVRSPVTEAVDSDWGSVESRIVLEPEHRPGLRGLDEFSHVLVVALLHGARFEPARHLVRRPRGLAEMPELGIFAQRAKDRPNPIGITVVPLLGVEPDGIRVRGLDAIDGTPVLDLKPYFPDFDAAESPRVPEWVARLMRGYF